MQISQISSLELGNYLRLKRKEQNYRLEDLADENISVSTISNIELGKTNVAEDKRHYLIHKLGIEETELTKLIATQRSHREDIKWKLESVEHILDLDHHKGWKKLKQIQLEKTDPFMTIVNYLKAKYYIRIRDWEKATKSLYEAIRILESNPDIKHINLFSACQYELSRVSYFTNNLEQALRCVEVGLENFILDGERLYYRDILLVGKAIYSERLNKIDEVIRVLDELWPRVYQLESHEVALGVFEIRIKTLIKLKKYEEAIECAKQGLRMARLNRQHERSFELWVYLGEIYIHVNEWEFAENCFLNALDIEIKKRYLLITAYTQLSKLYIKQNRMDEARHLIEKAIVIGNETNSRFALIDLLITLGDCYYEQDSLDDAIEKYNSALQLAREEMSLKQEKEVLFRICKCENHLSKDQFQKHLEDYFRVEVRLQATD